MVDISIITVCYNDLVSLKRTLTSVQNLEGKVSFEHLIVDGGSKDGTVEFLNTLNRKNFTFISEPDDGIFDAFNKGISLSKGKWVHFLNAGDVYQDASTLTFCDIDPKFTFLCYPVLKRKKKDFIWKPKIDLNFGFVDVAHPGLIVKRHFYNSSEKYRTELKFVSDSWFIWHHVVPEKTLIRAEILVDMEDGGYSTKLLWDHEVEKQKLIYLAKAALPIKIFRSLKYVAYAIWRITREKLP